MLKNIRLFCAAILVNTSLIAQSLSYQNALRLGGVNNEIVQDVEVDDAGFVYLTGSFEGTVDFNPGPITTNLISNGGTDVFIVKLDNANNLIWAKSIGGTGNDYSVKICVNTLGDVYVSGVYTNQMDLNPGSGTINSTALGLQDFFILKLNNVGNYSWAQAIGGSGYDVVYDMALDENENPLLFGTYYNTVDFDPGNGISAHTAVGTRDIFLLKLDVSGQFMWSKSFGGAADDLAQAICTDNSGNIYATGGFNNTVDFDPGPGVFDLTSNGSIDIFILKFYSNGNFAWAGSTGSGVSEWGQSVAVQNNVLLVGGFFDDVIDANINAGIQYLTAFGDHDGLLMKLDTAGNFNWAKQIGGIGTDFCRRLAIDNSGQYVCTGTFNNVCDVDPGNNQVNLTPAGINADIYLYLYDPNGNLTQYNQLASADYKSISSVFISSANSYYFTGEFQNTLDFDFSAASTALTSAGLNDGFMAVYNVCTNSVSSTSDTSCGDYFWPLNGNTYTQSGIYQHTLPNASGCDSTITLNLIINNAYISTISENACNSYIWAANNATYTLGGLYSLTFTSSNGCDSVLNLNLTINNADTSVVVNATQLSAGSLTNASYQWLNCNASFAPIIGETNAIFVPSQNGSYALSITQNGCTDTSSCYNMNVVELLEQSNSAELLFYPNPATQSLFVTHVKEGDSTIITDLYGRIIKRESVTNQTNFSIFIGELSSGIYFLKIGNNIQRFIKE
jgi:hypothetical protein